MKRRFALISLALLFGVSLAHAEPAQIVIRRSANFGTRQGLRIWIDGTVVDTVALGHTFRTSLTPGRHVISVSHTPNRWNTPPTDRVIHVKAGQVYEFTGVWRGDLVYLK